MQGYWKNPIATADVLQAGWLKTGDLGTLDAEGFLFITGRKKEIIVTAGGKNISPAALEAKILKDPLLEQVLIVGEGHSSLGALVYLNRSAEHLQGIASLPAAELKTELLSRIAFQLSDQPPYEQIRRVALLPQPLSLETGELTAKLTLRRQIICQKYAGLIDQMYQTDH